MVNRRIPTLAGCHVGGGWMPQGIRRSSGHVPAAINIFTGCCCNSRCGCSGGLFSNWGSWGSCGCNSGLNWAYFGLQAINSIVSWIGMFRGMGSGMGMGMGNMFGMMPSIYGGGYTPGAADHTGNKTDKDATPIKDLENTLKGYMNEDDDKVKPSAVKDLYIQIKLYHQKDEVDKDDNDAKLHELEVRIKSYMNGRGIELPTDEEIEAAKKEAESKDKGRVQDKGDVGDKGDNGNKGDVDKIEVDDDGNTKIGDKTYTPDELQAEIDKADKDGKVTIGGKVYAVSDLKIKLNAAIEKVKAKKKPPVEKSKADEIKDDLKLDNVTLDGNTIKGSKVLFGDMKYKKEDLSKDALATLTSIRSTLVKYKDVIKSVKIIGNTSKPEPKAQYNMDNVKLSEHRANTVKDFFNEENELGNMTFEIEAAGKKNATEDNEKSRNVEIVITLTDEALKK